MTGLAPRPDLTGETDQLPFQAADNFPAAAGRAGLADLGAAAPAAVICAASMGRTAAVVVAVVVAAAAAAAAAVVDAAVVVAAAVAAAAGAASHLLCVCVCVSNFIKSEHIPPHQLLRCQQQLRQKKSPSYLIYK